MCTIHPPSGVILDMFDHVLLLAPVGRTVYFGDTGEKLSSISGVTVPLLEAT